MVNQVKFAKFTKIFSLQNFVLYSVVTSDPQNLIHTM